jgi:predicted GH43/DUF377 family glycosyl hydrolase
VTKGRRGVLVAGALLASTLVVSSSQAAGPRPLAGGFEDGLDGWNAYNSELGISNEGHEGAASLRWDYEIEKKRFVFIAKSGLDSAQFADAKGARVVIRSDKLGTLYFNFRERDESSYQYVATVGPDWQVVDIPFAELQMDADAGDENGRLDLDQIVEFWIVDASGYFSPQMAGPRTVWLESVELVTTGAATLRLGVEVIASGPTWASDNLKSDPTVLRDGDVFKLWYGGNQLGRGQEVYYATSSDGMNWSHHDGPVLRIGNRGEWDYGDIETPSVVKVGDTYHLYYCGRRAQESGGEWAKESAYQIGHATSKDGIQWVKDPANPVIRLGDRASNEWNWASAAEPTVVYDASRGLFEMWYVGVNVLQGKVHAHLGYTTSRDGSRFRSRAGNPVIASKPGSDSVEYNGYFTPEVVREGGRYWLFYVSDTWNSQPAGPIRVASSSDGKNWTLREQTLVSKQPQGWTQHGVFGPTVVVERDALHLWYTGVNYVTGPRFGIGYKRLDPDELGNVPTPDYLLEE